MNVIYFLLPIVYVNCQQSHLKPVQGLETAQYGRHATDRDHMYNVNISITAVPTADTSEVKTTKKAHQETFNHLKSTSLSQGNFKTNIQAQQFYDQNGVDRRKSSLQQSFQNSHSHLVQSYLDAKIKTPRGNVKNDSPQNYLTSHPPLLAHVNNNNLLQGHKSNESFANAASLQQKSAEHLKALRNVIALQLLSYNGDPQSTTIPANLPITPLEHKKVPLAKHTKSKVNNDEMRKKLAIIAAARALMEILDA